MNKGLVINNDKTEIITVNGQSYRRLAIQTPLVTKNDSLEEIVTTYAAPHLEKGDILFLSEKMVACTQNRAIPLKSIKPNKLAIFLSRFVTKSPYGIGLSMPETMTMAIAECGRLRILMAAFIGAVGKLFHQKGWFYHIAGSKAASIDGPCPKTIAPYNEYVVLGPADPQAVATNLSQILHGTTVLIVDINDLGGQILGSSDDKHKNNYYLSLLGDNPLGQTDEQTPMGIIRQAC